MNQNKRNITVVIGEDIDEIYFIGIDLLYFVFDIVFYIFVDL